MRGRVTAGGDNYPVPGGMIETAENLRREYAIPREEQDELALRSHQRAVAAQESGAFAEEIVPVEVRDRKTGDPADRARRAPARRRVAGEPGLAAPGDGAQGPRGHGHRRQRQRPERRRRGLHRHPRREGGRARPDAAGAAGQLGGRRGPAGDDGHRPGPGDGQGARARRPVPGRHGPDRAQRGVRRPGARGAARVGASRRLRARQRQRLGHLARPPGRRHRRPHPRHAAARAAPPRRRATGWRRCASAAARGWPRSSRTSTPDVAPGASPGGGPGHDEATLREVIETLAPLERRAGSEGERRAAEWIAQRLRAAGCDAEVRGGALPRRLRARDGHAVDHQRPRRRGGPGQPPGAAGGRRRGRER